MPAVALTVTLTVVLALYATTVTVAVVPLNETVTKLAFALTALNLPSPLYVIVNVVLSP